MLVPLNLNLNLNLNNKVVGDWWLACLCLKVLSISTSTFTSTSALMNRRSFNQKIALGSLALGMDTPSTLSPKTHILTLSFDDGFKKSFYEIARIHEEFGLRACLNVIASGHLPEFKAVGQYILPELLGNFDDWNTLKQRGHEIMPHSWAHLDKTKIPIEEAKELILKCLDYFETHLEGYKSHQAVYNFPFNASNEELDLFTLTRVKAIRTGGWMVLKDTSVNPLPGNPQTRRLGCWSQGPENIDHWVEDQINTFVSSRGGWLILNLHGLDGEGWGPVSAGYLRDLLRRLSHIDYLDLLPAGVVMNRK